MSTSRHLQLGLKIVLLSLFSFAGLLNFMSQATVADETAYLDQLDQSSLSPDEKTGRATRLGTPVPGKDSNKEMEILLKDPAMQQKWGLVMTSAQKAWQLSKGSKDIIVAIIDTGADTKHPDLQANLWRNKNEVPGNGKDDDGNGYVDDVYGWNFVANTSDLTDNHGHGTHIAGIVGAKAASPTGVTGVAPQVSLMILKYYDPKSPGINNLSNTVKAIDYAVKMGAHIINYSGGGLEPSEPERQAIERAQKKGILFVAAAGNEKSDSDKKGYYPADYDLSNIISVTAIDKEKNILPSSNWGHHTVDIAAPGNDIHSTLPNGKGYMTGTSQATAFVSGVAALLMAQNAEFKKADRVIKYLTQTGDIDDRLEGKTRYSRRLNSYRALALRDSDISFAGVRTANIRNDSFVSDPALRDRTMMNGSPISAEDQLMLGGRDILSFIEGTKRAPMNTETVDLSGDSNL